jgi:hypothetical protein
MTNRALLAPCTVPLPGATTIVAARPARFSVRLTVGPLP